jgi:hypothetical protein
LAHFYVKETDMSMPPSPRLQFLGKSRSELFIQI